MKPMESLIQQMFLEGLKSVLRESGTKTKQNKKQKLSQTFVPWNFVHLKNQQAHSQFCGQFVR